MLRVAIIGVGDIAQTAHLPAWSVCDGATVTAVVDRDKEVAAHVAAEWGIEVVETQLSAVLERSDIDAVDICVPANLHRELVVKALESGKHVLVEKPVAIELDDALRMSAAHSKSDKVLMIAENWAFEPNFLEALDSLRSGRIGTPYMFVGTHVSAGRLSRAKGSGKGDRDRLGYFFAAGSHTMNLARMLMGEVASIFAFATNAEVGECGLPVEDDMVLSMKFESGSIGSCHFTGRCRHSGVRRLPIQVIGENGSISFDIWNGWVETDVDGQRTRSETQFPSRGYREEVRHFVDCIKTGSQPVTSITDQICTLQLVRAAYETLVTKRPANPVSGVTGK